MHRSSWAAFCAALVIGIAASFPVNAQQGPKGSGQRQADPGPVNAPEKMRGRSVTIDYVEIRTARPDGGGTAETARVPFRMVVYISTENRAFNRLGNQAGSSDQVIGAKGSIDTQDIKGYATRDVAFDGPKMTVVNQFGRPPAMRGGRGEGSGKRVVSVTFDANFKECTANVAVTVEGSFTRRRMMKGGFEELLSATNEGFTCRVHEGNALLAGS